MRAPTAVQKQPSGGYLCLSVRPCSSADRLFDALADSRPGLQSMGISRWHVDGATSETGRELGLACLQELAVVACPLYGVRTTSASLPTRDARVVIRAADQTCRMPRSWSKRRVGCGRRAVAPERWRLNAFWWMADGTFRSLKDGAVPSSKVCGRGIGALKKGHQRSVGVERCTHLGVGQHEFT